MKTKPCALTPEQVLAWAEKVESVIRGEELMNALRGYDLPVYPLTGGLIHQTCNCPPYGICMNVACPRAVRITCAS